MDRCLEKKIYDRQIKKQGMSDRIVDECNPEAHLSMKDITNLCQDYDSDEDTVEEVNKSTGDLSKPGSPSEEGSKPGSANMSPDASNKSNNGPTKPLDDQNTPKSPNGASHSPIKTEKNDGQEHAVHVDGIINTILDMHRHCVTKEPFMHESLLVDQKDRKLSQAEKRQAHRSYELEKKAAVNQRFTYAPAKMNYKIVNNDGTVITKPMNQVSYLQIGALLEGI